MKKTWNILNKEYGNLTKDFRDSIADTIKKLCKSQDGNLITFNESVFVHLITDNINARCKKARLEKDGSIIFESEIEVYGNNEATEDEINELDCAALYEIMLALKEKQFTVTKQ